MTARYLIGDVRDRIADIPDQSVDLIVTSPPYLALRSYLLPDDPAKAKEIGSERTPAQFVDVMLELVAAWRRVLAPHGSMAIELGDTYSAGNDGWPRVKGLSLTPELLRVGLAYGINPLTGDPSPAGRWIVRNVVVHARPNPVVGILRDKFRPACSYWAVITDSPTRYFDLRAVCRSSRLQGQVMRNARALREGFPPEYQGKQALERPAVSRNGVPPLDWHRDTYDDDIWEIPTTPYPGPHYAVFSPALVRRFVVSMCPERVCTICGEPSRPIESEPRYVDANNRPTGKGEFLASGQERMNAMPYKTKSVTAQVDLLGWTECECAGWRKGVVLDPFGGSGTTGMVAEQLGRDSILIDLDRRNADLALERIGAVGTIEIPDIAVQAGQAQLF